MTDSEVNASNAPLDPPKLPVFKHPPPYDKCPPDTPITDVFTAPHVFPPYNQSSTSSQTGGGASSSLRACQVDSSSKASLSSGFTARSMDTESTYEKTAASPPKPATTQQDGFSWRCQSCGRDPCDDPTAASCGHIFCFRYAGLLDFWHIVQYLNTRT